MSFFLYEFTILTALLEVRQLLASVSSFPAAFLMGKQ